MARSRGDPRLLFVLNVVLSSLFCYLVLRGLAFVGAVEFTWVLMAGSTAALVVVTRLVTR